MIPVTCPKCHRHGTIPPDKLGTRLHCPRCDAVFHLDQHRHVVSGPPRTKTAARTGGRPQHDILLVEELDHRLAEWSSHVPYVVKAGLPLVLIGILVLAWILNNFDPFSTPRPIEDPAMLVALAVRDHNTELFHPFVAPGTEADADRWLDEAHRPFSAQGSNRYVARFPTVNRRKGGRVAQVVMNYMLSPSPTTAHQRKAAQPMPTSSLTVSSVWVQDRHGNWRLDGSQSLESLREGDTGLALGQL